MTTPFLRVSSGTTSTLCFRSVGDERRLNCRHSDGHRKGLREGVLEGESGDSQSGVGGQWQSVGSLCVLHVCVRRGENEAVDGCEEGATVTEQEGA